MVEIESINFDILPCITMCSKTCDYDPEGKQTMMSSMRMSKCRQFYFRSIMMTEKI